MIVHFYECDECKSKEPIIFVGWPDANENVTRLPEGWLLIQTAGRTRAACSGKCAERLVSK